MFGLSVYLVIVGENCSDGDHTSRVVDRPARIGDEYLIAPHNRGGTLRGLARFSGPRAEKAAYERNQLFDLERLVVFPP